MITKGPVKDFEIVFLEDLYKEIEENENIFFIRLSECYCDPLGKIFKELRRENWQACIDGIIIYMSSEKFNEVYVGYNFKGGRGVSTKTIIYSGSSNASKLFSVEEHELYKSLNFDKFIHFSSNKTFVEKMVQNGKEVLQKLEAEAKSPFEMPIKGSIFSIEVEKNNKLSKYLWNKEDVRESIPSYFNRPSQRKVKNLDKVLKKALKSNIYYTEEGYEKKTTIEKEMRKSNSGALYLPLPLTFNPGKDSVFNTKRIKTSKGVTIRKLSPITITSQGFYGYPNKSKNARVVRTAFLHRYGVYKHEDKELGEIDVHLLEPILIVEYTGGESIPFEVITSQRQEGSRDEEYKVFLIEKPEKLEDRENIGECKNKKIVNAKYKGEINLIGGRDTDNQRVMGIDLLGGVSIETSGSSIIEIDLEKGEAREEESKSWLEVKEYHYSLSRQILDWALYRTKPSALVKTPPAPLVVLQVLRDVAKGRLPGHEKNKEIPESYLESIRKKYELIYHLLYNWSIKVIKSINTDYLMLPKELEGVKLLEKMVKDRLIGKETLLDKAKDLCIKTGEGGERFTITIDFGKKNMKKLNYSWGEKISLREITPLKIKLPIWYIISGKEYLLLFPKSNEEKLERMDEIRSINIMFKYKEDLKQKNNYKVEIVKEFDLVAIEFEFCDGTRISGRPKLIVLGEVNRIQEKVEIWYDQEKVTEELNNIARSLIGSSVRRRRR
jgi:hypothetical protein